MAPCLTIERIFTRPDIHPYDDVVWERRDVVQTNWRTGATVFEQRGVEFPDFWSENATQIVTTKYFRGAVGTPEREWSLRQLIDRVVNAYVASGLEHGYFADLDTAGVFRDELTWMLLHQVFSFNSPVWFNIGTTSRQFVSACFILSVDDSIDSILNWYREEGLIFKGGSGAGVNLSRIRGSKELTAAGGTASGPVSFMRGADASAGTIKSGGATRRAAKMVRLDVDHPDISAFIATKANEEAKIRVLRDAGFDMDLGGDDISSVQYQNANNSVGVTDTFMQAVVNGFEHHLVARTTGETIDTVDARTLFREMAQAAWECADPGIQYDTTINDWHTCPEAGPITASNPCSEYLHIDNSSCNLASLNLAKFVTPDGRFDPTRFTRAVELIITAMDMSICFAEFPTDPIGENTRRYRQLGIGYANLGALLMAAGLPYDSDAGRAYAAAITSLMSAVAYRRSAELAELVGPYDGFAPSRDSHLRVIAKHRAAADTLTHGGHHPAAAGDTAHLALAEWDRALELGDEHGYRNSQVSVCAPTGTIGFMMDCDTTGIEPAFALTTFKKLVGGASLKMAVSAVPTALARLGYQPADVEKITAYVTDNGTVVGAPGLRPEHHEVFDCAVGERSISPMGHVRMMAAVQPFLSGAISKTVNLPETATVEDIEEVYLQGWFLGLKALAVYRDNCKVGQPLSDASAKKDTTEPADPTPEPVVVYQSHRDRLPAERTSRTISFEVGGQEGYVTFGEYPDGRLGEMFLKVSKQGSTMAGIADALGVAVSVALQYGVPLETLVSKYVGMDFAPKGMTRDADVRIATSILDFVFRKAAMRYLAPDVRRDLGIYTTAEKTSMANGQPLPDDPAPAPAAHTVGHGHDAASAHAEKARRSVEKPMCPGNCGTSEFMTKTGACWACSACGSSSGCS